MKIGVLAIQGDFAAHAARLRELGVQAVEVRTPAEWDAVDGLVIPGGESGAFLRLLGEAGFASLQQFVHTKPSFGTCAGAIMLATNVVGPAQPSLGVIDMTVRRNAYGRQIDSSIRTGELRLPWSLTEGEVSGPMEMVFIRAPKIERVGPGVETLATESSEGHADIVAVRQGKAMAATFHPELSSDPRLHRCFVDLVRGTK